MPRDLKQVLALLGGVGVYHKFLRLGQEDLPDAPSGVKFECMPAMEAIVCEILAEFDVPPILVFPDWDAVADGSRPFHVLRRVHRRFWSCA